MNKKKSLNFIHKDNDEDIIKAQEEEHENELSQNQINDA